MFKAIAISIALYLISPYVLADDPKTDLTIVQGSTKRVLTENDFQQLQVSSVEVDDPVYNKKKHYTGYWLSDIFVLADMHPDPNAVLTFIALDGYKSSIPLKEIMKSGAKAFVAIADLDEEEGWEKIQDGKELVSPGPYYLVWQIPQKSKASQIKLPWPYQMIEISIDFWPQAQQKLFPDSNDKTDSVTNGYKVFQNNCMACHSINLEGGVVGPELNVPKNILEYESRAFLKSFIGDPSAFRARSKMPSFNKILAPQEINDVLNYLAWVGKHKASLE